MSDQVSKNFWDDYEKDVAAESGGGGIIATVEIETVYKGFVTGMAQADSYRSIAIGASEAAKTAVKKEVLGLGADEAKHCLMIRAYRENAVSNGKPANWPAGDRFFFENSWTSACKEVVVPSLRDAGIVSLPFKGWARIGFKSDPFKAAQGDAGKTDIRKNDDGTETPIFPQVAYVVEVFANMEAAQVALDAALSSSSAADATADAAGSDGKPAWMEGTAWEPVTWKDTWPELHAAKDAGQTNPQIAKDYDVPVSAVVKALADYIPL